MELPLFCICLSMSMNFKGLARWDLTVVLWEISICSETAWTVVEVLALSALHVCTRSRDQLFCDPVDCSPPGSSVGIFQAGILKWIVMSSSRGSFWPRGWTGASCISCLGRWLLYHWATRGSCWLHGVRGYYTGPVLEALPLLGGCRMPVGLKGLVLPRCSDWALPSAVVCWQRAFFAHFTDCREQQVSEQKAREEWRTNIWISFTLASVYSVDEKIPQSIL